jgi:hypothetical protein
MKRTIVSGFFTIYLVISIFPMAATTVHAETGMVELYNLPGARQAAMGEIARLDAYDPFNLEYNPAFMVGVPMGRIGISHHSFIQDRSSNSIAVIFPVASLDFGVNMRLSQISDIERRTDPTINPIDEFSAYDFAARAHIAIRATENLDVGLSAGWLMEKIDRYRGSNAAVNLGARYRLPHDVYVHGSVANLGPRFEFIQEETDLPLLFRGGLGWTWQDLYVGADYVNIKSGESHIHFGAEYLVEDMLYLRGGYQTGYDSRDFSAGLGFVYNNYRVDYAYVPYDSDLGDSHRFTFYFAF